MSIPGALLLFVDGVGIAAADPARNPLAEAELPALRALLGQRPVAPGGGIDATLGMPGRPQSATGQTAILTGLNAPELIGGHLGPYPDARLRGLLAERSLFARVRRAGRRAAFANAYPDAFRERVRRGGGRLGAMARASVLAGMDLRGSDALREGRAVAADLTGVAWRERLGIDVPEIDEEEAGRRVAALATEHELTVHEYFLTDVAGHRADPALAARILAAYDRFLAGVLDALPEDRLLVLVSDHGNLEDLSHGRHTRNAALFAWRGEAPRRRLRDLTDVAPAIAERLELPDVEPGERGAS